MVWWSLASVAAVSVASLAGILTLSWSQQRIQQTARIFVAFAVGALLGDAFIHLIPEAFGRRPLVPSLLVLAGFLGFFVLEKLVRGRKGHAATHAPAPMHHRTHPSVVVNLTGDALHNFVDGMLIAGSFAVSPTLGVSTALAVLLHELPQELGDFGVLVHGGLPVRRAVLLNLLTSLSAFLGAGVALVAASAVESFTQALLPITAGGFIYLAAANLVPELHHHSNTWRAGLIQVLLIAAGIGVMALLALLD